VLETVADLFEQMQLVKIKGFVLVTGLNSIGLSIIGNFITLHLHFICIKIKILDYKGGWGSLWSLLLTLG
jgi:hypothetical protein